MSESDELHREGHQDIEQEYRQALLEEKHEVLQAIELAFRDSPMWSQLERVKREVDEMLIA